MPMYSWNVAPHSWHGRTIPPIGSGSSTSVMQTSQSNSGCIDRRLDGHRTHGVGVLRGEGLVGVQDGDRHGIHEVNVVAIEDGAGGASVRGHRHRLGDVQVSVSV